MNIHFTNVKDEKGPPERHKTFLLALTPLARGKKAIASKQAEDLFHVYFKNRTDENL